MIEHTAGQASAKAWEQMLGAEAEMALLGLRLCKGGCGLLVDDRFCERCARLNRELDARLKAFRAENTSSFAPSATLKTERIQPFWGELEERRGYEHAAAELLSEAWLWLRLGGAALVLLATLLVGVYAAWLAARALLGLLIGWFA